MTLTLGEGEDPLLGAGPDRPVDLRVDGTAGLNLVLGLDIPAQKRDELQHGESKDYPTHFLIVGRETPLRASSGCAVMHS